MNLRKIITILNIYFLASATATHSMDSYSDFFYGNTFDNMTIHSIIDESVKKTTINIDHVNGGVIKFFGKTLSENSKEVGVHLMGVNSFGKILVSRSSSFFNLT